MKLYNNLETLKEILQVMKKEGKIDTIQMAWKDYFLVSLLKEIKEECPNIIFKGGTSLSKCYKIIDRFSEDIDLTCTNVPGSHERKEIVHKMKGLLEERNDLKLLNEDEIWRKKEFNKYLVEFPSDEDNGVLNKNIVIETAYYFDSFPSEEREVTSMVYDYLHEKGRDDIIKEYELEPFTMKVQSLSRTFIDKVFALCDYYLRGKVDKRARHIYDLYRIYPNIQQNEELKILIEEVRNLRKQGKDKCPSSQDDIDINILLDEIIKKESFKQDFKNNTMKMFLPSETATYEEVITVLTKIKDSKLF